MTDFKLKYQIVADAARAKAEVKSFDDLLKGAGGSLGTAFAGPAAIAAAGVAAIGAAGAAAGVALFNLSKNAAEFGSEIFDASKKTGLGAESLSAMKFAADQSGTSLDQVTSSIGKFSIKIGQAADGSKEAAKDIKAFGLDPQAAVNDLDGALGKVFKQIMAARPGVEQNTLAFKAFGKQGKELLPFLDSFDGDLGKLIKKAKDLGVTIDDEAARAADEFGDQLDTLNAQLAGVGRTIGMELMPVFNDMAKDVSSWLASNKGEIQSWAEASGDFIRGISALWRDAADAANEYFGSSGSGRSMAMAGGIFGTAELIAGRGRSVRRASAGPAWEGDQFELDPATNTLRRRTVPRPLPGGGAGPGGGGAGKRRPPRENDAEFRRFFEELGFGVNRTYGRALNAGSLHPSGQAADIKTHQGGGYVPGNKQIVSNEKLFGLVAAAIEKGYKFVDERERRNKGATGPHAHFEKGGNLGASSFLGAGMYGGPDQLAYLKQLDAERLGKASGQAGFQQFVRDQAGAAFDEEKEINDGLRKLADEMIAAEQDASDKRLSIRTKEADQALVMLEGMVARGEITELEAIQRVGQLRIDMLEDEQSELAAQIPTEENLHRLEELRLEIGTERLKNTNEEFNYWKKIADEIERQNRALEKKNQRPGTMKTRENPIGNGSFGDRLDAATGRVRSMDDVMHQLGQTATDVFMQMGQGLGAMLESWVLLGDQSEASMQKMLASVLAGVAAQAATLSIFHLAMGIAALTPWGAAMYGSPTLHFKAAALWGAIAVGTALAGRAVAGDSNQSGGGRGSSAGSGAGSGSGNREQDLRPLSRESDDVYISGNRTGEHHMKHIAKAIEKLHKKIGSMSAGEVLVAGSRQKKGFVANQFSEDVKANSALGTKAYRSITGGR